MDPLKMAYGVKHPMTTKQDNIKGMPDQHKRYYPVDQHGQLDEWGALVKHQAEVHDREVAKKQNEALQQMKNYHQDLDKVVHEKN